MLEAVEVSQPSGGEGRGGERSDALVFVSGLRVRDLNPVNLKPDILNPDEILTLTENLPGSSGCARICLPSAGILQPYTRKVLHHKPLSPKSKGARFKSRLQGVGSPYTPHKI